MMTRQTWGWIVLALGGMLLLGGGTLLYWGVSQPPKRPPAIRVECGNIVKGCLLPGRAGRVSFDRAPQTMKPFQVRVETAHAGDIHAGFAMRDMQMGLNRYRLLADGNGQWKADITLPVCTNSRSDWVMTLEIDDRLYQLPFSSD